MEVYDLRANHQKNPLGIELQGLMLSWKVRKSRGSFQRWARVRIWRDEGMEQLCYDSGQADLNSAAFHPEVRLEPGRPYYWQAAVWDDAGDYGESECAIFEGGHPGRKWQGEWICAPFAPELHPVFQKEFKLEEVERARLYICGLGLYETYINGQRVGDEYLTPYFTDYRYWVQYQSYDVKPLLRQGKNRLDVYMGNGWYKGRFGYMNHGELREYYGSQFKLIADLYAEKKVGGTLIIGTDESWLALKSPVIASGIYDGEIYDARMEPFIEKVPPRKRLYARKTQAPSGVLEAMTGVGVKKRRVLKVKRLVQTDIGETILDFGQEITGWVVFRTQEVRGTHITLQYGEILQNGRFYRENLRTAKAEYTFISNGDRQIARPHFTFYGFRYVKITGMRVNEDNIDDFEAWALYSDLEDTGTICTSNHKVNRLIENTMWSARDNFLDIPTDCPQRDERLGWTGDAQIFSETACYHMRTAAFFRKYLKDMRYEQEEKGGAVPYVVPDILTIARERNGEPAFDLAEDVWGEAGSSLWGDAATVIPWNLYRFYGDRELLREQYENMKQWVDFIISMDERYCNGERIWRCGFHFGDWLSLDSRNGKREGETERYLVASVFYMYSSYLTSHAAGVLGYKADQAYYARIAREVRDAIRRRYIESDGRLSVPTQTAYVLGIHFHLFEKEELPGAATRLQELLRDNGNHLSTGFAGTAYLCQALTEAGLKETAYDLLLNEDYPGWLYEVNAGATTIWERWDALLPDGSVNGTEMNSLNHYAYGAVAAWIYQDVCGLRQEKDGSGFKRLCFFPHTDRRLEYALAEYNSVFGIYRAGWERRGGKLFYILEVPFNCQARLLMERGLCPVKVNGQRLQWEGKAVFDCGLYEIEVEEKA